MLEKEILVRCQSGLYNKQATYFVQKANEFDSDISLEIGNRRMNAKSLLGIMSLGVASGTSIILKVSGTDEEAAAEALENLLQKDVY
jgi:phosphotransferase system HPr (HPr) family protein